MRFDDSLSTIMSADTASTAGAQATWRQLVDLAGRGRIAADTPVIAQLRLLRQAVPLPVRAATARALAFAHPAAPLVGLFAEDSLAVAAPVLRTATLPAAEWLPLLSRMGPEGRSVLRHRRDLPPDVMRGLESFGTTDFVLPFEGAPAASAAEPQAIVHAPRSETPFVAIGDVARGLPVVAEARHRADATPDPAQFEISDLVARIDAFNRRRDGQAPAMAPPVPATVFRYETDAMGTIRWVDGISRAAIVGVSLAHAVRQGEVSVDAVTSGALRRRSRFEDARMEIGGRSDAAGDWRVSGAPTFDAASGRFTGMRGMGRRPRPDESAASSTGRAASDSLRQLVHELRTPTNAIAGFAELIEAELLGPVAPPYRDHAIRIREQAGLLVAAIDDLDTAARIEGGVLELRAEAVDLDALLERVMTDLEPLITLRNAVVRVDRLGNVAAWADERALHRLLSRLTATLVTAAAVGEVVSLGRDFAPEGMIALRFSRPRGLGSGGEEALLSIDNDDGDDEAGASLLGAGFALRLARNLAREMAGELVVSPDRLTLRLPAVAAAGVMRAGK